LSLAQALRPRSVAVVGASENPERLGGRPLRFLEQMEFPGDVYPVNPRYEEIGGLRCYPSLEDLPAVPDAVVVVVPREPALAALKSASELGVPLAVVLSSGIGDEDLAAVVGPGMRLIGPNTSGVTNLRDRIPLAMSSFLFHPDPVVGHTAIVSQSGGLASPLVARAFDRGVGLSHILLAGNQFDVGVEEMIDFLVDDEGTRVILCVLEGSSDGPALRASLRRARLARKPVVVLKAGRSTLGARAAVSHTASLTGNDAAYQALFAAEGAISVDEPDDLLDLAVLFARYPAPASNRIAVLSVSGGGAVLLADRAADSGLELPDPGPAATAAVRDFLGEEATVLNPLDLTGKVMHSADGFRRLAEAYLDDDFDLIVVGAFMNTMGMTERVVDDVIAMSAETEKPIVVIGNSGSINDAHYDRLRAAGVPFYQRAGIATRALGRFCRFGAAARARTDEPEPEPEPEPAPAAAIPVPPHDGDGMVAEADGKELLSGRGVPVPRSRLAAGPEEALAAARELGYPVVVKSASTKIAHKSDIGAVRVGIGDDAALAAAAAAVSAAVREKLGEGDGYPVLVEQQLPAGHEAIVGIQRDPQLGPLVTIGPGGALAELFRGSHASRLAPLSRDDVTAMLAETPLGTLLAGYRGAPPADVEALTDVVIALADLALDLGDRLGELECNPVIVAPSGATAVDTLIKLVP
jgi:acyl-CoA synthetase (NDP forming)